MVAVDMQALDAYTSSRCAWAMETKFCHKDWTHIGAAVLQLLTATLVLRPTGRSETSEQPH